MVLNPCTICRNQKQKGINYTMKELSKMAMAYYQLNFEYLHKLAPHFFGAMDHDGDGKIELRVLGVYERRSKWRC